VGSSTYASPQASIDNEASGAASTASTVGAVVGVVGGCALLLVIVVVVVVRRRSTAHVQFIGKDASSLDGTSVSNPAFVLPAGAAGMAAGLDNPMYVWWGGDVGPRAGDAHPPRIALQVRVVPAGDDAQGLRGVPADAARRRVCDPRQRGHARLAHARRQDG
jgi:hypothetical protein